MPVVQAYGQRKVGTDALPGVRMREAETDASSGVGLAQATAAKWNSAAQVGETLGRMGVAAYAAEKEKADHRADVARRLGWQNQLATFEETELYDPEKGALTVQGMEAVQQPDVVGAKYTKLTGEIAQGLTAKQRLQFQADSQERGHGMRMTLLRHADGQVANYQKNELESLLKANHNEAGANATDGDRVKIAIARSAEALRQNGPHLGLTGATLEAAIAADASATHVAVIESLLAQDQIAKAKIYFEETQTVDKDGTKHSAIAADRLDEMQKKIADGTSLTAGLRSASALWAELGPKTDNDPINLDTMEDRARTKYADDPKALEVTMKFLRERKAAVDASRADRREQATGASYLAAAQGHSLESIMRTPEYARLPDKDKAAVTEHVLAIAERNASRANSEAQRGYAEESRDYTRAQRKEKETETANWSRYWDLSEPTALNTMSENQLNGLRGELGDDHVNRLLTQKRGLAKGEQEVRAATIDDDLFKTIAKTAGYNPYKPSDTEKGELGQLKNAVETAIDVEQQRLQATGKKGLLNRDEKEAVMRKIVDQKVMLNRWFGDPERVAATVVEPEDRKAAYVPIGKIPAPVVEQYLNFVRGQSPALARMPDKELRARYNDRIQRAYAAASPSFKATRADVLAILTGKDAE